MRLSTDLDSRDLDLLRHLQEDARASLGSLAEKVNLSSPATAERLKKLRDRGVITGYSARIDPSCLALDITALIQVRVDSSKHYPGFLENATGNEEVQEVHAITGDASHLLKIRTKNTESLERLLSEIQRWPGVIGTRTNLVLSTHKETGALPMAYASDVVRRT